jgi:hypothetical protein
MKEDEDIAAYFLQVDEIVNVIKGLGDYCINYGPSRSSSHERMNHDPLPNFSTI